MSLNKQKCDPILGQQVHNHLVSLGLETPQIENSLSVKERIAAIEGHFHSIMVTLGLDLTDDSLIDTPKRVAKMYVSEIFYGLDYECFPKCTAILNKFDADEMIVERNVNVMTNCEHHFVTIDGLATVGYIPGKKVIGLSKINRIVEYFSKRPQVQERLNAQIHAALCFILETDNVAVMIDAKHYCVASRGIEDTGSFTTTSKLSGAFKEDKNGAARQEFMAIANSSSSR
jgi:GTP cyclohydrolase I